MIAAAQIPPGGAWADLGAGSGAFTLALRQVLGPKAEIYAVDTDGAALAELRHKFTRRFGQSQRLHVEEADFRHPLDLPTLDGVLMANSLHFHRDKLAILNHVREMLRPGGTLLLVEYNVDHGNPWVPHPLSFDTLAGLVPRAGFSAPTLAATQPSSFLKEFYCAATVRER